MRSFRKHASVLGDIHSTKLLKAVELLRKFGYRVDTTPIEGIIDFEAHVYPTANRGDAWNITDLQILRKLLQGKKMPPRSMWNIV